MSETLKFDTLYCYDQYLIDNAITIDPNEYHNYVYENFYSDEYDTFNEYFLDVVIKKTKQDEENDKITKIYDNLNDCKRLIESQYNKLYNKIDNLGLEFMDLEALE
jgi:hypothetical protein